MLIIYADGRDHRRPETSIDAPITIVMTTVDAVMVLVSMDDAAMLFTMILIIVKFSKTRRDEYFCAIAPGIALILFLLSAVRSTNRLRPFTCLRCICIMMSVCQLVLKCLYVCATVVICASVYMTILIVMRIASLADIASVAATKNARTAAASNGPPMPSGLGLRRCTGARER